MRLPNRRARQRQCRSGSQSHWGAAYSPAKPSPISRILMLAASLENAAGPGHQAGAAALLPVVLNPHPNSNPNWNPRPTFTATAVFEPPLPGPAPEALSTFVPVPAVFKFPIVNAPAQRATSPRADTYQSARPATPSTSTTVTLTATPTIQI